MGKKQIIIFTFLLLILTGCGVHKKSINFTPAPIDKDAMSTFYYLKFLELAKQGKYNDAKKSIQKAIEYNPSPELFIEYAKIILRKRNIKEAENVLKSGLQKNPGNKELIFFLSDIYSFEKKYYNAYSLLKIFLKDHPNDIKCKQKIAHLLFQEKEYKEALKYLLDIPEKQRDYKTHFFMGKCYIALGNREKAIYHLKKSTMLNPEFLRGWAELAYQYELKNDLVSAEKIYSKLLSRGFANKELVLRLIEINIKLGNPEKACSIAEEFLSDPGDLINATGIFLREGLYDQAETLLKTISSFQDEYPTISYYMAIIKLNKYRDKKGALNLLNSIPKDADIYLRGLILKTKILISDKRYKEAENILKEQIKKHPDRIELINLLSDIYIVNNKINKAKELIEKALKQKTDDVDLLYQLATIYYKLKDIKKAISIMEKILTIDPDNASALNFIGYTYVDQNKNMQMGYKFIKRALSFEPENGYFLDSMAWYYYKTKDYKKAWEYIKKAVKNVSSDPTIWEHYGDIALELKKIKEAKKGYQKSLLNHPEDPIKIKKKLQKIDEKSIN